MPKKRKIFVLDTNVILHDSSCIYQFQEHDIVIPIPVLEELDQFKTGSQTVNYHAREFVRALDSLSGANLFDGGVRIGPNQGKISIKLEQEFHPNIKRNFSANKVDHHILNTAYLLSQEEANKRIVLVSKDVNLRMKSKAIGIPAEDYRTDHVQNISELYRGHRLKEEVANSIIDQMYQKPYQVIPAELALDDPLQPNESIIIRNPDKSALAYFDPFDEMIKHVDKKPAYGIIPRNAEQTFALNVLTDPRIRLVTLSGKAGTGKTLLALAGALECRKEYKQIYMARPIVPLSNRDIGYLPGDIKSKLDPYMQPLYDNLGVIKNQFPEADNRATLIEKMMAEDKLVIAPLSYIRGRSLVKIFFIVDEAQNLTPHEIKTIITRAGEDTKMIFTGDIYQIDHPYLDTHSNGLSYLIDRMQKQKIYAHINLEKGERSQLAELASDLL